MLNPSLQRLGRVAASQAFATPVGSSREGFLELGGQQKWGLPDLFSQQLEVYVPPEAEEQRP